MRRWIIYLWCLLALGSAGARGTGELAVGTDDSYLLAPESSRSRRSCGPRRRPRSVPCRR
jgi:hypothetical protein